MKNILLLFILLPASPVAQDINIPYVQFDQGAILFYLPSESAYPLLLPATKPGFVHILRTPGFQTRSNQEISDQLVTNLRVIASRSCDPEYSGEAGAKQRNLVSQTMTQNQKGEFLEKFACLILLNSARVASLDTLFYATAVSLQEDAGKEIRERASLVVKMADLYRKV